MKNIIILILACLSAHIINAQAPVMDSAWMPRAGDKYYEYQLYGDTIVSPNDTGANRIWDFKNVFLKGTAKVDSFDFVVPLTRSISCLNSWANLAKGVPDNCLCFIKNVNGVYETEEKTQFGAPYGNFHEVYLKPELWMKNNFAFRQSFNDTSIYYNNWNNSTTDSPYRDQVITHWKYDGYGILKIAGMEFDTAVRVRKTFTVKDTAYDVAWDSTLGSYDEYIWFTPRIHSPLARLTRYWHIESKRYSHDTLKTDIHAQLTLPASGPGSVIPGSGLQGSNASFNGNAILINGLPSNFTYALFDATGRLIMQGNPRNNKISTMQIPANISQGMYILKLQDNSGQSKSIKLVKDR
jgi:hypothetical protein